MGCDDQRPYSKPRPERCRPVCKKFKLVASTAVGTVSAECLRCGIHHDISLKEIMGKIEIEIHQ